MLSGDGVSASSNLPRTNGVYADTPLSIIFAHPDKLVHLCTADKEPLFPSKDGYSETRRFEACGITILSSRRPRTRAVTQRWLRTNDLIILFSKRKLCDTCTADTFNNTIPFCDSCDFQE